MFRLQSRPQKSEEKSADKKIKTLQHLVRKTAQTEADTGNLNIITV
jgi:hypothetical protein